MLTRIKKWASEHVELERWLRFISPAFLYSALDDRLTFKEALAKALKKQVPAFGLKYTFCMGGTALLLFVNQVVTGVLLAVYYKPSPEMAFSSIQYIEHELFLGWLVRQMHAWGANLMVLFVTLHMIKVFFNKAYRPPRELTWVTGTLLFFLTVTFGFTGYLLPWDQLSYWASTVGTELVGAVPWVGKLMLLVLRGGEQISGLTMSRFFAVHVIVLPWIAFALLLGHFMLVRRLGISRPL